MYLLDRAAHLSEVIGVDRQEFDPSQRKPGQQLFAGEATRLAYLTDEAVEGRDAFLQKRDPDWSPYPWHY